MEHTKVTEEMGESIKDQLDTILNKMSQFEEIAGGGFGDWNPPKLTPIELKVLENYLDGFKSREIAEKLEVTTSHVSRTLKKIEKKLGRNRRKWAAYSIFKI